MNKVLNWFLLFSHCLIMAADFPPKKTVPTLQELATKKLAEHLKSVAAEQAKSASGHDVRTVVNEYDTTVPNDLMEDLAKQVIVTNWPKKELLGLKGRVRNFSFSHNTLQADDSHKNVCTWDLNTFNLIDSKKMPTGQPSRDYYALKSDESNRYRAAERYSDEDFENRHTLEVFDKNNNDAIMASWRLNNKDSINTLRFTPDNELLIATSGGESLHWNFTDHDATPQRISRGPAGGKQKGPVFNIIQTPSKKHAYSFSKDKTIRYGSIKPSESPVKTIKGVDAFCSTMNSEGFVAAGGWGNEVNVYKKGELKETLKTGEFTSLLTFSKDGKYLAIGGSYGKVFLAQNPETFGGTNLKELLASMIQLHLNKENLEATPHTRKRLREVSESIQTPLPAIMRKKHHKDTEEPEQFSIEKRELFL